MVNEPQHPLGPVRARFRRDPGAWRRTLIQFSLFGLVGLMFIAVALFAVPEAINPGPDAVPRHVVQWGVGGIGALLAVGCAAFLWWERRYRDTELVVRERGVVLTAAGEPLACRWEDIREVLWDEDPRRGAFYKLKLADSRRIGMSSVEFPYRDVLAFGAALREGTSELDEPPVWAHFLTTV
jgi:hypothetical protein